MAKQHLLLVAITILLSAGIDGQSRKDLLWEYKKMRDNDAHLGIVLAGNANSYSNAEIYTILYKAWQKKEMIILLQLLGYLENSICYIPFFTDNTILEALNRFSQSISKENLSMGETETNRLLLEAYQSNNSLNNLPQLIREKGWQFNNLDLLLRVFKKELEVSLWIRPRAADQNFWLLKTYSITDSIVSILGPKSALGDRLTPEGIYQLEYYPSFRWSDFYLAFKISYPNEADEQRRRFWKIEEKAGGAINLHGCCVSIGCIPIGNPAIEELFILIRANQNKGTKVLIHIFPFKFRTDTGQRLLQAYKETNRSYYNFWLGLQDIDNAFLLNKQIPNIRVAPDSGYYYLE